MARFYPLPGTVLCQDKSWPKLANPCHSFLICSHGVLCYVWVNRDQGWCLKSWFLNYFSCKKLKLIPSWPCRCYLVSSCSSISLIWILIRDILPCKPNRKIILPMKNFLELSKYAPRGRPIYYLVRNCKLS